MAISYSNPPTLKPFSVLLAVFMAIFLLLASQVNSAQTLSFNFPKFTPGDPSIILQGNAEILANGILDLTNRARPTWSTGRALYTTPVHIWDSTTGNVASFVTSFSFVVEDVQGDFSPADGIVFFLAPTGTQIPNNSSGGFLGVIDGNNAFNQFVGVEFDSFINVWDPDLRHIGIDVNSLVSLKTVKWDRVSGALVNVNIIYDSSSKTLSVAVATNGEISTIAQVIDLRAVLPEEVRVGFSATTTSGGVEAHDIHSWSFTSILETTTSSTTKKMSIASYA